MDDRGTARIFINFNLEQIVEVLIDSHQLSPEDYVGATRDERWAERRAYKVLDIDAKPVVEALKADLRAQLARVEAYSFK